MSATPVVPQPELVPKIKSPHEKVKENESNGREVDLARIHKWIHDENEPPPPWNAAIDDLAKLTEEEYETVRKKAAKRLSIDRIGKLDEFVETRRKKIEEQEALDNDVQKNLILTTEPWDTEVDLSALLDEIATVLRRFVVFHTKSDANMLALWVQFSYVFNKFNISPLAGITASDRECGKTTLLRALYYLVYNGYACTLLTTATAFRIVDMHHPTLLADELDKFLNQNPELLAVFLAGHERDFSWVPRMGKVQDEQVLQHFDCFGPKAWGQIGLPDNQLTSRSLITQLRRAKPGDTVEKWPRTGIPANMSEQLERMRRQCLRWAKDNETRIAETVPDVAGLGNRIGDNWYPLLVIATLAGEKWKVLAKEAAGVPPSVKGEESMQTLLLRDIRNILHTRGIDGTDGNDRIPSAVLLQDLLQQEESPWPHYERNRDGMDANQLGILLRGIGIESNNVRIKKQLALRLFGDESEKRCRGFVLRQFQDLFERQLDGEPERVPIHKQGESMDKPPIEVVAPHVETEQEARNLVVLREWQAIITECARRGVPPPLLSVLSESADDNDRRLYQQKAKMLEIANRGAK